MPTLAKLLNSTHLYALIAFIATLAAKVALEFHGTPTADFTNLLYGEGAAIIGVPIVNTAITASATANQAGK